MVPQPESQFLDAPALFIEARFRGRVIAGRLLRAQNARAFTIGAARRADAPVDPAFLPADRPANDNHALVEPSGTGFVVNLSPAMRARVEQSPHRLRVPCGEVIFELSTSVPEPALPRPWLAAGSRARWPYTLGVAAALIVVLAILQAIPSDPHALSLDDVGRTIRMAQVRIVPPVIIAPPVPGARGASTPGGAQAMKTRAPAGTAGDPRARSPSRAALPRASGGAGAAAQAVRDSALLRILDDPRSASVAAIFARDEAALGPHMDEVLAELSGASLERVYAAGSGFGPSGTGAGGADTGRALLGGPGIFGVGVIGPGSSSYEGARRAGALAGLRPPRQHPIALDPGSPHVRGGLDKEIIRRVVRQHLNEVRFCYSEALARNASLTGRVVVQFTIAPTGRVLVAALQSSSLEAPAVAQCIVEATRRWEYPRPEGGGIVVVSYPFQLVSPGT